MNEAITPWSVKGIDEETRKIAREKAKEARLPIGTWINKIILEQQAQVARNDSNLPNSEEQNAYEPKEFPTQKDVDVQGLSKALGEYDSRLEKELRPIIFGLNELALRLVAAEALKSKQKKSYQNQAPIEDIGEELVNEEIGNDDDINKESYIADERPAPVPPTFDLEQSGEELFSDHEEFDYSEEVSTLDKEKLVEPNATTTPEGVKRKPLNKWLLILPLLVFLGGMISVTAFIFPTHYKTFFYKYSDAMLVNMSSIFKTVEDAYDEVDHIVTKTILKFIGLKDDPKVSSEAIESEKGSSKGVFSAGTEAAQIGQSNEHLNSRTTKKPIPNSRVASTYPESEKKKKVNLILSLSNKPSAHTEVILRQANKGCLTKKILKTRTCWRMQIKGIQRLNTI